MLAEMVDFFFSYCTQDKILQKVCHEVRIAIEKEVIPYIRLLEYIEVYLPHKNMAHPEWQCDYFMA